MKSVMLDAFPGIHYSSYSKGIEVFQIQNSKNFVNNLFSEISPINNCFEKKILWEIDYFSIRFVKYIKKNRISSKFHQIFLKIPS